MTVGPYFCLICLKGTSLLCYQFIIKLQESILRLQTVQRLINLYYCI